MLRLLAVFSLIACSTASLPDLPKATADRATILVPGYKGSFLADEQVQRVWLTPGDALGSGDTTLALDFPGVHDGNSAGPLHPDGPITRLSIAVPFGGAAAVLKDLARGDSIGRNHALLSAGALFTFASGWQLAPPDTELSKPEPWLAGLRPFAGEAARTNFAYETQLRHQLVEQRDHWHALQAFSPNVRSLVVIGSGRKTVSGVSMQAGAPDFDHPPTTDGDGLVTVESARPKFQHEEVLVGAAHGRLLDDEAAESAMTRFFSE